MFPYPTRLSTGITGFPRIRGDVPIPPQCCLPWPQFSPHTRGCSAAWAFLGESDTVFPAYAGMFRHGFFCRHRRQGFPRIRGDVPKTPKVTGKGQQFSPHTRGCSGSAFPDAAILWVFPAYAGMFRVRCQRSYCGDCFPRIRGDVPFAPSILLGMNWFSPHTRGCSAALARSCCPAAVFPAYAGMFRALLFGSASKSGFPRIRGDVPSAARSF